MHRTDAYCRYCQVARSVANLSAIGTSGFAFIALLATLLYPSFSYGTEDSSSAENPKRNAAVRNLMGGSTERFLGLARRVQNSSFDEKAEFVRISLEEMAYAFSEEAEKAREEFEARLRNPNKKGDKDEEKDPRKWISATNSYAGRLQGLSESLTSDSYVDVRVSHEGAVILVVGGRNVIVSGPRIDRPEVLENRIIERVCVDTNCNQLESASLAPAAFDPLGGRWNFDDSSAPVFTTNNGLNFLFDDGGNLSGKERACVAVAQELDNIIQALKNMLWQNSAVDWDTIAILRDPNDTLQKLRINRAGDFVRMQLPQLAQTPYVLQSAMPWVRSQVGGTRRVHYVHLPPNTFN